MARYAGYFKAMVLNLPNAAVSLVVLTPPHHKNILLLLHNCSMQGFCCVSPMFDRQGVETHMLRTTVLKCLGDELAELTQ